MKANGGMEVRHRESMTAKAFVEARIDERARRKLRKKHPQTINNAVKHAQMVEEDQLREEQWQEFDKEDKETFQDRKSNRSREVKMCILDQDVSQVCTETPKKTEIQP